MSIDRLRAHYGFSRMPFGKERDQNLLNRIILPDDYLA